MKKKKIIVPVSIVLVICLVGGGIFTALQIKNSNKTINVVPVTNVSTYAYEGYSGSSGRVTSDVSQTVYLESEATVKDVYVQEGDKVTVGMPLMQYDTELMQLDIDTKELDIKTLELSIQQANKDIQSLKNGVVPANSNTIDTSLIQPPASSEENNTNKTSSALSAENTEDTTESALAAPQSVSQDPQPHTVTGPQPTEASDSTEAAPADTTAQPENSSSETPTPDATQQTPGETSPPDSQTPPEITYVDTLDKDFDFSRYNENVNSKGEIVIPCKFDTKITPEFINLLRGKNPDGSERTPDTDPQIQQKWPSEKIKKVILTIKDFDTPLILEPDKLNEPYINTVPQSTLQQVADNGGQLLTEDIEKLDTSFFQKWPQTLSMNRTFFIECTSQTLITPEFIFILHGRNADGSVKNETSVTYTTQIHLKDLDKNLELKGETLPLPYVTSVAGSLADFIENEFELDQEPVKELGKDTVLDVSHDHREVFEIYCDDSTIITKDFINRIRDEKKTVILKIKDSSWITLDGSKLEEPSENAIDTPIGEFVSNGIALNEKEESTEDISGGDDDWSDWGGGIDIGGGGGVSYTADEIKKMLSDKQLELSKLQTQKRQAQLDLAKLQRKLQKATVTSAVNGVVTKLAVLDENTSTSDPFMVINSTEGLYLTGSINELDLGTLTVGQTISAMSWNTGSSFDATIKEVSPYPTTSTDSYGKNPNSSSYPFIALIDNPPEGLMENEYVEITTGNNSMMDPAAGTQNLYLAKAYILTEGTGESYVFVAGGDGRLEKRLVKTGKIYSGSYIEITNNAVTQEDYIAFPYGKNIKEGLKTTIDEQSTYMYY